jgi:Caspase domain
MSLRFLIKFAALASTCWISVGTAFAENRIALVIGNSNYTTVTALPNPANDAKAMANFLKAAGFEVLQAPNLSQSDMRKTIGNFANVVSQRGPDTVVLVFYAGHGLQVDGENFLVPVDAQIDRESDVPLQAMRLADVMNMLSSVPSKSKIVILDACRNNPFSAVNKTGGRGLAIVDAPNGSLVSYSTAPGNEALDGDGENSPFTTALTKIGQEPGLPVEQLLKRVRLDVSNATNRQQFPWESSSLTTEFSFFPGATGEERPITVASKGQPSTTAVSRSETRSVEAWQKELKPKGAREAYEIVVREDKVEAYQAYIALYPSQPTTPVVRNLVDRRQVVIAWYNAVTINTVASYRTFLASYGNSDFAVTANRLVERAATRSVSNPASAFASTGLACPCSVPATPILRQKRTDLPATQEFTPSPISPAKAAVTGVPAKTGVAVIDPTPPITVYPTPPVVVVPPPRITIPIYPPKLPPRHDKPDYPSGNDKPGKHTGDDKPKTTGTSNNDTPPVTRGRPKDYTATPKWGNNSAGTDSVKSVKTVKSITSVVPRQSFGQAGAGPSIKVFSTPRISFGRGLR